MPTTIGDNMKRVDLTDKEYDYIGFMLHRLQENGEVDRERINMDMRDIILENTCKKFTVLTRDLYVERDEYEDDE